MRNGMKGLASGALAACCLMTAQALAGEMPDYDPKPYCEKIAAFTGTRNDAIYATCIQQQYEAKKDIVPYWHWFSSKDQKDCENSSFFVKDPTYTLLKACLWKKRDDNAKSF